MLKQAAAACLAIAGRCGRVVVDDTPANWYCTINSIRSVPPGFTTWGRRHLVS